MNKPRDWELSEKEYRKRLRKVGDPTHGHSSIRIDLSRIDQCPECCSFETKTNEVRLTIKCFDCGVTSECDTLK